MIWGGDAIGRLLCHTKNSNFLLPCTSLLKHKQKIEYRRWARFQITSSLAMFRSEPKNKATMRRNIGSVFTSELVFTNNEKSFLIKYLEKQWGTIEQK